MDHPSLAKVCRISFILTIRVPVKYVSSEAERSPGQGASLARYTLRSEVIPDRLESGIDLEEWHSRQYPAVFPWAIAGKAPMVTPRNPAERILSQNFIRYCLCETGLGFSSPARKPFSSGNGFPGWD